LFALAIAQAQPGCDAGGAPPVPTKADAPQQPASPAKEAPAADTPAKDDAIAPALAIPPKEFGTPPKEPVDAAPEAANLEAANPEEAEPNEAEAKAKPRPRTTAKKPKEPDAKVFLPATKSGAFIPRQESPQAANPPANQQ
jgi:hypothetical protein